VREPAVFFDYIPQPFRNRISILRDRYGEQRFRIVDFDPRTRAADLERVFLQIDGFGKGTYRPYHEETTLGGLFNRIRLEHMDREGIDHQVIYGSMPLAFNSLIDSELALRCVAPTTITSMTTHARTRIAFIRSRSFHFRIPSRRYASCAAASKSWGWPGLRLRRIFRAAPAAPERFPEIRVPKPLSHADFHPIYAECERLDVAIGLHGAPGVQLAGGSSDQLDTFTLVHAFANRSMQQMALPG